MDLVPHRPMLLRLTVMLLGLRRQVALPFGLGAATVRTFYNAADAETADPAAEEEAEVAAAMLQEPEMPQKRKSRGNRLSLDVKERLVGISRRVTSPPPPFPPSFPPSFSAPQDKPTMHASLLYGVNVVVSRGCHRYRAIALPSHTDHVTFNALPARKNGRYQLDAPVDTLHGERERKGVFTDGMQVAAQYGRHFEYGINKHGNAPLIFA